MRQETGFFIVKALTAVVFGLAMILWVVTAYRVAHGVVGAEPVPVVEVRSSLVFEPVDERLHLDLYRARVPGGWIYATRRDSSPSIAFVPDPSTNTAAASEF